MNHKAIDAGATAFTMVDIPDSWKSASSDPVEEQIEGPAALVKQVKEIMQPINTMNGYDIPVSAFVDHADGQFELGVSAYEKRGVAVTVPRWDSEICIQCNNCSYVCPHAAIRPFALDAAEVAAAANMQLLDANGKEAKEAGLKYTLAISPLDCMGCSVCVTACPRDALTMMPIKDELPQQEVFDYCVANITEKPELAGTTNVKASQFKQPLLEFSGRLRWLRRNAVRAPAHPALRRSSLYLERNRLLLDLGQSWWHCAIHGQPRWTWSRMEQLSVRGQRRAWSGHVSRLHGRAGACCRRRRRLLSTRTMQMMPSSSPRRTGLRRAMMHRPSRETAAALVTALEADGVRSRQVTARGQELLYQEELLDSRWRWLGVRHRLRWSRSCHRQQGEREHLRLRYRGLLEHGRASPPRRPASVRSLSSQPRARTSRRRACPRLP